MNVVRGKLKLKGKHNKVIESLQAKRDAPVLRAIEEAQLEELVSHKEKLKEETKKLEEEMDKEVTIWGTGRVVTSGTVVTG